MTGKELDRIATEYLTNGDYDNAMKYFLQASEEGYFISMFNIACMYYFGDGVEQDYSKAYEWYVKASEAGDKEAMNRVGMLLAEGTGVEKDPEKAFEWYLRSAKAGSLSGMASTGYCYLQGFGTEADLNSFLAWMNKASRKGNGIASLTLGDYYAEHADEIIDVMQCDSCKSSVPKEDLPSYNLNRAREYYERGMKQKYAPAILKLAEMYEKGLGVEQDPAKAEELKELAANTPDED